MKKSNLVKILEIVREIFPNASIRNDALEIERNGVVSGVSLQYFELSGESEITNGMIEAIARNLIISMIDEILFTNKQTLAYTTVL